MEKSRRLNNRGYMLVEIILASAIAFGIAYFIIDLTINLKNKNDDLLVTTLTATDQAIITNSLMKYLDDENFCDNVKIVGKSIQYNGKTIVVVNDYAEVGSFNVDKCKNHEISIPISVKQLPNNYDVELYYQPINKTQSEPEPNSDSSSSSSSSSDSSTPTALEAPIIIVSDNKDGSVKVDISFNVNCSLDDYTCQWSKDSGKTWNQIESSSGGIVTKISVVGTYVIRAKVTSNGDTKSDQYIFLISNATYYSGEKYCQEARNGYVTIEKDGSTCKYYYEYSTRHCPQTINIEPCGTVNVEYISPCIGNCDCTAYCEAPLLEKEGYYKCAKSQGVLSGSKCIRLGS